MPAPGRGRGAPPPRLGFRALPAWTNHVFVGGGDGPSVILAVGARPSEAVVYPESELARRHRAGVEQETNTGREAYAAYREDESVSYRKGWLPDF